MNKEEIFSAWVPDASPWSTWAKPVLFAHLHLLYGVESVDPVRDTGWSPPAHARTALVLDLPGAEGVWMAVGLAQNGYRPVPLYNAIPSPVADSILNPFVQQNTAVDVLPIVRALCDGAAKIAGLQIFRDAPPAFLLDARRHGTAQTMPVGSFDNRSVCYTTDFPSANFLLAAGIQKILLVQTAELEPLWDLAHVLRRWQDGGIKLERIRLEPLSQPEPFTVSRPSWFRAMFARVLIGLGLRRAGGGGYGAWVPEPSSGG
jgi:hypothetical protein